MYFYLQTIQAFTFRTLQAGAVMDYFPWNFSPFFFYFSIFPSAVSDKKNIYGLPAQQIHH